MLLNVYLHLQTLIFSFEILAKKSLLCLLYKSVSSQLSRHIFRGKHHLSFPSCKVCLSKHCKTLWLLNSRRVHGWKCPSLKWSVWKICKHFTRNARYVSKYQFQALFMSFHNRHPTVLDIWGTISSILWVNTNRDSILENLNVSSIVYYHRLKMLKSGKNGHQPRSQR